MIRIALVLCLGLLMSCSSLQKGGSVRTEHSGSEYAQSGGRAAEWIGAPDLKLMTASATPTLINVSMPSANPFHAVKQTSFQGHTKGAMRELKREIKKEIRQLRKEVKHASAESIQRTAHDHDLKLAILFGVVGIVGIILGLFSSFLYVIGGLSLLVGVVFFVVWGLKEL